MIGAGLSAEGPAENEPSRSLMIATHKRYAVGLQPIQPCMPRSDQLCR